MRGKIYVQYCLWTRLESLAPLQIPVTHVTTVSSPLQLPFAHIPAASSSCFNTRTGDRWEQVPPPAEQLWRARLPTSRGPPHNHHLPGKLKVRAKLQKRPVIKWVYGWDREYLAWLELFNYQVSLSFGCFFQKPWWWWRGLGPDGLT